MVTFSVHRCRDGAQIFEQCSPVFQFASSPKLLIEFYRADGVETQAAVD